jgi:hypothetical protein
MKRREVKGRGGEPGLATKERTGKERAGREGKRGV